VFSQPTEAVSAAVRFQRGLPNLDWPDPPGRLHARVGIHSGEVLELGSDVFGPAVNRAARVMHAAWPDQIVVSNATAEASEGEFNFEDLGTHYLKGLTRSMHLFQVVADGVGSVFPVLRTLSGFPNNLPSQLPSMFGRDGLVEEVLDELATHAVVTLTGPGGMGKTRLALEVAAHAGEHNRDGVWVVELAPLDKAETVAVTAAGVLRVPDRPGRSALDRIAQQLVDYQTLIVLDNCEHVAEAAAEVAATMTGAGNEVRVLATSREPLWIAGERAHAVPPLGAGGIDSPSVTLFVERAKAVRPTFDPDEADLAAISRICERLDGLPLAMELAAARVRAMSVAQLESRLDDRFRVLTVGRRDSGARHDALQTAIAWSYELLTEEQARFFAELSVFAGRAALPSVETVLQDPDAIDHLTELTDKSLVRVTDADDGSYRYSMFESIRLYAEDKLVQTGRRDELRGRHLTFCAQSAMDIGRRLDGREQRTLLPRVAELLPDLRGAMTAAVDLGRHGDGATIAAGLYRYWYLRAVREGRDWLEVFYGQRAKLEPPLRARVLYSLGSLLQVMGEYARSAEILDESVTLYRQLDNPRGLAYAMHYLARSQWGLRPFPELMQLFEESTEIFVDVGDKVGEGLGHLLQSVLLAETGDIPGAFKHAAEFRRLADEVGAPQLLAHQREFEGSVMRLDGRVDESIPLLLEGLRHYQVLANPACSAHCMENAAAAVAHFDPQGAATILAATQRLRADIGVPSPPYEQLYYDDTLTKVTMVLEDEELDAAWKAGEALDFTEALERTAEALEAVGRDRQPPSIAS
jgi:predicted ATPase